MVPTLPIGSRSGCAISECFSITMQLIAEHRRFGPMCHILDDFLRVALNEVEADTKLGQILSLCNLIGGPIVVAKTKKGSCLLFIGIELDSKTMQAQLPQEKLESLVKHFQTKYNIFVMKLESLTGLLNFACKVVIPGRAFLKRFFFQLLWGMKKGLQHFKLRPSNGTKEDLRMWKSVSRISMELPCCYQDTQSWAMN